MTDPGTNWSNWTERCLGDNSKFRLRDSAGLWHDGPTVLQKAKDWESFFRKNLQPNDRILIRPATDISTATTILGALRAKIIPCLVEESDLTGNLTEELHPQATVEPDSLDPMQRLDFDQAVADMPRFPEVSLLMRASEHRGAHRWKALGFTGIHENLKNHRILYQEDVSYRVYSSLPWQHAFGLVLDLFLAIHCGLSLIRKPKNVSSTRELLDLCKHLGVNALISYPRWIEQVSAEVPGKEFLEECKTGLIGSGPINKTIASAIQGTQLRVSYGITEGSPGVLLGEPGEVSPHFMGRPLGCEVRRDKIGNLQFRGKNRAPGSFVSGNWVPSSGKWEKTQDIVEERDGAYYYRGRQDDLVRLAHGQSISAKDLEDRFKLTYVSIEQVWIHAIGGKTLVIAYTSEEHSPRRIENQLRTWLPFQFPVKIVAVPVPGEFWILNEQGTIDRPALLSRIGHSTKD